MNCRFILTVIIIIFLCGILPGPVLAQKKETREVIRTGVDVLMGNSGNTLRPHLSFGYNFTPLFSAGFGTGYVPYRDPVNLVPVFLDLVYQMRDDGVTPFFQLKTGFSISFLQNDNLEPDRHRGGFIFNPAVGIQLRPEEAQGFYLTAGFNLDHSVLEQDLSGDRVMKDSYSWRRISVGAGFILP